MTESLDELFLFGEEKMEKAIAQLQKEFGTIRSGRANPGILDKVVVEYYGAPTPLRQMSQVSVQDGTTLVITPYDKTIMKEIEKAIIKAEIGITPNSDGTCIRLTFPPLTEDRRKEIAKDVKKLGEEAKVAVRNIRRDMTDNLKKIEKNENLPEDMVKDNQDKIQKLTDKYTGNIDNAVATKEKEVMGNLNHQTWDELWNSPEAEKVRKKVRCCDRDCWMIGSVSPAMHKYIWKPATWVLVHKFKALFKKNPYSMYENKICRDYRDGKVTKEELDKCSTCDMRAVVNNGLSEASMEQLKNKTGEEIVDADIAAQMKQ